MFYNYFDKKKEYIELQPHCKLNIKFIIFKGQLLMLLNSSPMDSGVGKYFSSPTERGSFHEKKQWS